MNRYRTYGALDDLPQVAGDAAFTRLDLRADPATLPAGSAAASENFRFDAQGARVRGGLALQFRAGTNIGRILYAGIYTPVSGADCLALVTSSALVLFDPADQTARSYAYPTGETIGVADSVDLVQAGIASGTLPDLYVLRGLSNDVLKFNGSTVAAASGFPKSNFGLFYQDRIAAATGLQGLQVSGFLDFATWAALTQFEVLKGGDDYLVGFLPYQKDLVVIGTRRRFFLAYFDPQVGTGGYDGSLAVNTSYLRELTREGGPVGRRAMKEAGGLIWFVSDNGIYAFQPQLDLQLTVLGKPISADVQPVMDRLCAKYAGGACIEAAGYRLYFAVPIGGERVRVASVTVTESATVGLDLPFDLPALLTAGALAEVETEESHDLTVGDQVQCTGAVEPQLNGEFTVVATPDDTHFVVATEAESGAVAGALMTAQRVVTRNNTVLVFNLHTQAWESVDRLPSGCFADFLRVADYGARRRLWVIDRDLGPALYEEGDADVIGDAVGGVNVPFDLPVELSVSNFEAAPMAGRLLSRTLRWGPFAQRVQWGAARLTLGPGDAGTVTLRVRTPDAEEWESSASFANNGTTTLDRRVRLRCGKRGLEAEVEVVTSSGRPTVRALEVETASSGRVKEE